MQLKNKYIGSLYGLALGDALGAPYEFWKTTKVQEVLANQDLKLVEFHRGKQVFPKGFATDDTAQMLCLAESLLENGFDLEDQFQKYYLWFTKGYGSALGQAYGMGQQTMKVLLKGKLAAKLDGSDTRAGGNGALMRTAPLALYYFENKQELIEKTLQSTYVTHNSEINGYTCALNNIFISLIFAGVEKKELIKKVTQHTREFPDEVKDILELPFESFAEDDLEISGYCVSTLKIALWAFLTTDNFHEAIKKSILLGRDTDTFAAVTGAIAGAYYGFDRIKQIDWGAELVLEKRVVNVATQLFQQQSRK